MPLVIAMKYVRASYDSYPEVELIDIQKVENPGDKGEISFEVEVEEGLVDTVLQEQLDGDLLMIFAWTYCPLTDLIAGIIRSECVMCLQALVRRNK